MEKAFRTWRFATIFALGSMSLAAIFHAQAGNLVTYRGWLIVDQKPSGQVILTFGGEKLIGYRTLSDGRRVALSAFNFQDNDYDIDRAVVLLGEVAGWNDPTPENWEGEVDFVIHPKGAPSPPPVVGIGRIKSRDERDVSGEVKLASDLGGDFFPFLATRTE